MVPGSRAERLVWVDVAKGLCIVLVVVMHVATKSLAQVIDGPAADLWVRASDVAEPMRMPLFFVISGLLAASSLRRPWRQTVRPRVVNLYYLYALWLVVGSAVFGFFPLPTYTASTPAELAVLLLTGVSNLWYLYALAGYYLLARLGRTAPTAMLTGAAAVSLVTYAVELPSMDNSTSLLRNVVFFLVGAYLPRVVSTVAAGASVRWWLVGVVGYLAATGMAGSLGPWAGLAGPVLAVLGVCIGATGAVLLSGDGWITRWSAFLGRRTLPIYVLHLPVLAVVSEVVRRLDLRPQGWTAALYAPVVTVLLIVVSLGVHALARRLGGSWLFGLPALGRARATASIDRRRAGVPRPA